MSGIVAMLAAVGLFALMDVVLKLLAPRYPALQVAALRGGASLPLSTAYTLFFVAPLMITALSVPVLGERVGPRRWGAIAFGLLGVVVVLRPSTEGMVTWAGLAVLVAAAGYAMSAITVRVLSRTDSTQSMVFWLLVMLSLGAGALAAPGWVPVQAGDWPLIAALGLSGALGQIAINEAFRRTEASVNAPLEYTALAWGVGFDALLWGCCPIALCGWARRLLSSAACI